MAARSASRGEEAAMTTILAAIDGTPASGGVLTVAKEIARVLAADIDVVHVIEMGGAADAEAEAARAGLMVRSLTGPVEATLVSAAGDPAVEAVVVGVRRTIGGSRPAGHVALEVIRRAQATVVAVPPATSPDYELKKVLVPVQGRPAQALGNVITIARDAHLDVVILHVHDEWSIPSFEDQPHYDMEAWAAEFLARWVPGARPETVIEVRVGAPADEILGLARELDADMMAIGWMHDLSPGRASIVRAVLERSPIPIALLPLARQDDVQTRAAAGNGL